LGTSTFFSATEQFQGTGQRFWPQVSSSWITDAQQLTLDKRATRLKDRDVSCRAGIACSRQPFELGTKVAAANVRVVAETTEIAR
jgi:hypothetical protein